MESMTVKRLLEGLTRRERFHNWHVITPENIRTLLVEPFAVQTDQETQTREMWIVSQERREPTQGYVIVYDPLFVKAGTPQSKRLQRILQYLTEYASHVWQ